MEPRAIRVFVSSTFRDMSEERDELTKRAFVQLRRLCDERRVTWGEVDLRWGITDEQKAEGRVLPICLAEIQRCRPYFLGLLGERYGWVPGDLPDSLVHDQPWLADHRSCSVTELEIMHGVLNDPAMRAHAFFYFRSPAYIDTLPPSEQAAFCEVPSTEAIERLGPEGAQRVCDEQRRKLAALKERIRRSGLPIHEDYANPRQLAEFVVADLTRVIDQLFPAAAIPDPLEREAASHEAFAASRRGIYIGRRADLDALDAHAAGAGPPLAVLGESGCGKSALLANWAAAYRQAHSDELVVEHYVGATAESADWAAMVRRVIGEIDRRFGSAHPIPDDPARLRQVFRDALRNVPRRRRVVLAFDGLNRLEDRDQAPDLVWLPEDVPSNVRVIVSSLPGRPLDAIVARRWPTLRVELLPATERRQLIVAYLEQYTKSLAADRVDAIVEAPQTANPLFLRTLLEELRLYGDHLTLGRAIASYLEAASAVALFRKILARYEADYERDRPGLVKDALSLLWAARQGLSERELLDMLGGDAQPLPHALWAPLHLAAEASLLNVSGLIAFGHDYLRDAVAASYLPDAEARRQAHLRLADYFEGRDPTARVATEAPWQLREAGAWRRLSIWLAHPLNLSGLWNINSFEPRTYWQEVERHSSLHVIDAYREVIRDPSGYRDGDLARVVMLLENTGHAPEALGISRYLLERYRASGNREALSSALERHAGILMYRGEAAQAKALLEEQERLCRELGRREDLQGCLYNQGIILVKLGQASAALRLFKEQERISRDLGDNSVLQESLAAQAELLRQAGDLKGAEALLDQALRICREMGLLDSLARALGVLSLVKKDRGRLDEAMALRKEEEQICRELGDPMRIEESLGYQALILRAKRDYKGSLALSKEAERICREIDFTEGLVRCLGNQAILLLSELNRPREALPLVEEAHALASKTSLTELQRQVQSVLDSVRARVNVGWRKRLG